jgi:hypothetical protein
MFNCCISCFTIYHSLFFDGNIYHSLVNSIVQQKYQKAVKNRKGQVPIIKIPIGPYGGESSGINDKISRSIRIKN